MMVLFITLYLLLHPVHISVATIEIDNAGASVSFKVDMDDLTRALNNQKDNQSITLSDSLFVIESEPEISNYFQDSFKILGNKKNKHKLEFQEYTPDGHSGWFYYELIPGKIKKPYTIENTIFLELNPDQTNLLIICEHGTESGYRFNINTKQCVVE